jgi:PleD family two-component response regulator
MKFNVTVDLSEYYGQDEEGTLADNIKSAIAFDVKNKVVAEWKEQLTKEFSDQVKAELEAQKQAFITDTMMELFEKEEVCSRYNTKEKIPFVTYIKEEVSRSHLTEGKIRDFLDKQTKDAAIAIGTELKNRYDIMFASQLVRKLNENGMLLPDVAKLLLS